MSEVFMMVTITDRKRAPEFLEFYKENKAEVSIVTLGKGTANDEVLDYLGLEVAEKTVILSIVTDSVWKMLKRGLQRELQIDVPGVGIAFIVPVSSIGGKRELMFLTENQDFEKGEETILKESHHTGVLTEGNGCGEKSGGGRRHCASCQRRRYEAGRKVSGSFSGIGEGACSDCYKDRTKK